MSTEKIDYDRFRKSVIDLWRHRKSLAKECPEGSRHLASQCREDVAKMLGKRSWAPIAKELARAQKIKKKAHRAKMYPHEIEFLNMKSVLQILEWAGAQGAKSVYTYNSGSVCGYFSDIGSVDLTRRKMDQSDICAFMKDAGFDAQCLEYGFGGIHFQIMVPSKEGSMKWYVEFKKYKHETSLSFEQEKYNFGKDLDLPQEDVLLSSSGLSLFVYKDCSSISLAIEKVHDLSAENKEAGSAGAMYIPLRGPHYRQHGEFMSTFGRSSFISEEMVGAVCRNNMSLGIEKCDDEDTMNRALRVAQSSPVYMGISSQPLERASCNRDPTLQRVCDGLIQALEVFDEKSWKDGARRLVASLNIVVSYVEVNYSSDQLVMEYLVFDDALRKECFEEIEGAQNPEDLRLFLAGKVLEQRPGILDQLSKRSTDSKICLYARALQSERAWISQVQADMLSRSTPTQPSPCRTEETLVHQARRI